MSLARSFVRYSLNLRRNERFYDAAEGKDLEYIVRTMTQVDLITAIFVCRTFTKETIILFSLKNDIVNASNLMITHQNDLFIYNYRRNFSL